MRITFVLPHAGLAGGIKVVAIYAERLQRRGHDVVVVSTPRRTPDFPGKLKSLLKGNGWPKPPDGTPSHFDGRDVDHRIIDRYRPITDADLPDADVVVATWWETAEWVAALSPAKGAKAYFIQGYEVFPGQPKDRVEATYRLPFYKITISNWLAETMREAYGAEALSLIRNGVDLSLFSARERGRNEHPTVGMLYSSSYLKGCDVSLCALKLVQQEKPGIRLVSFGGGPGAPELIISEESEYHHQPPQDEIRDIYAKCDVWVCGSRTEGFHLPPLEAMACRCPVVSTKVGGPADIIEDGWNGYLVDVEDSDALADRLVRVLNLPEAEWREMSDAAYDTATRYTWDDATDLFEEALETAIVRSRRGELATTE